MVPWSHHLEAGSFFFFYKMQRLTILRILSCIGQILDPPLAPSPDYSKTHKPVVGEKKVQGLQEETYKAPFSVHKFQREDLAGDS